MTDIAETIARVRELDAAATKGPWSSHPPVSPYKDGRWSVCDDRTNTLARVNVGIRVPGVERQDAALIAYYRAAAPQLAVECERLQTELEMIRDAAADAIRDGEQVAFTVRTLHVLRTVLRGSE